MTRSVLRCCDNVSLQNQQNAYLKFLYCCKRPDEGQSANWAQQHVQDEGARVWRFLRR
ncbi:hypothetical protein C8Q73DRAFT_355373 [Cubamyces lactineus]|nr:hypothetical protein C8Q73DRAFT_355373 [Cubamyces lactineus]